MQNIISVLQQPQYVVVLLCILVLLIVLFSVVLLFKRREMIIHEEMAALKRAVTTTLPEDQQATAAQIREMEASSQAQMQGLTSSMLTTMSEVGRSLQGQMESFHMQINNMNLKDEQRIDAMRRMVDERLVAYERRMETASRSVDEKILALQKMNEEQLTQVRITVGENLDKRLGESFRVVSERLEKVYQGFGEMQSLTEGVGDLRRILSNVKVRGIWGETQLGALLEQMLAPSQFEKNVAVLPGSSERVEFAVRMPGAGGQPIYLPIDAKFPQSVFERLMDASESGDSVAIDMAGKQLEGVIMREAKKISEKYIQPPYTTDFALLFLPVEGLYAEVIRRQSLQERLQNEYRVIVAGPTTLAALLNSLQMGFRSLAIEQRTGEVWELLRQVKAEFDRFSGIVDDTQTQMQRVFTSLDKMRNKIRILDRQLAHVERPEGEKQDEQENKQENTDE